MYVYHIIIYIWWWRDGHDRDIGMYNHGEMSMYVYIYIYIWLMKRWKDPLSLQWSTLSPWKAKRAFGLLLCFTQVLAWNDMGQYGFNSPPAKRNTCVTKKDDPTFLDMKTSRKFFGHVEVRKLWVITGGYIISTANWKNKKARPGSMNMLVKIMISGQWCGNH